MAPTALLCPAGSVVQSLCQSTPTSSSQVWQAKSTVSSGPALGRPSTESIMEGASVKSCIAASVYESRRGINARHVVRSGHVFTAAVEGSVAVEEVSTDSEVGKEEPAPEVAATAEEGSSPAAPTPKRALKFKPRGNGRSRREDATVPAEALIPGAVFTGKVTTIQTFGAFVNFGAFTDGLVHISKLSSGYVSNVGDFVTVGQEVQVTVIDVDNNTGRIGLSMAEKEEKEGGEGGDNSRFQEGAGGRPVNRGKSAGRGNQSSRRDEPRKPPTKLTKGQAVEGTVKSTARGGVYVSLPEDEEAFLKYSEIPGGENMAPEAGLQAGQKIKATVLRIDRGKITLSMKPVVDINSVNSAINKGQAGAAANPFEIAFRAMDLIPKPVVEEPTAAAEETKEEAPAAEVEAPTAAAVTEEASEEVAPVEAVETLVEEAAPAVEEPTPAPAAEIVQEESAAEESIPEAVTEAPAPASTETPAVEAATPSPVEEKTEEATPSPPAEASAPAPVEEVAAASAAPAAGAISAAVVKQLRDETGAGMMECKKALSESQGDFDKAREALRKKGLASADKKASRVASEGLVGSYVHDSRIGVLIEVNCETDFVSRGTVFNQLVQDLGMQVVASQDVQYVSVEDIPEEIVKRETELELQREDLASKPEAVRAKIVEGRIAKRFNELVLLEQPYIRDDSILVKDLVKQTIATLGENIKVRRFERYTLGEGLEKKSTDFAAEVAAQTAVVEAPAPKVEEEKPSEQAAEEPAAPAVAVSAASVKQLRDATGAGMMECKKALSATGNDVEKAVAFLRKKGLANADKKASRLASEGLIGTYIHNGSIGVLVEVNCETDFVARSEKFRALVKDIAMQVVACPSVQVVSTEDIPEAMVEAERALELGKEDLANKPEAVRAKIVEGRLAKTLSELSLLEQPFIKEDSKLVKDVIKEIIAALGENIQVRRFTRFNLGEGIEKKVVDFAAEVAAQTGMLQ